ncbi:vacuolar sorting protein 3 isoform X2 [Nymphaea colorata]|uniref:vacuolar sorting protein 3 isoform X2 n=1 Tax=Nymphaea colorata TaxID=210225 RepID=UPI00129D68F0|nr:vacuolar sorting protein 3 isoform X2 [Nymphaea colorata]
MGRMESGDRMVLEAVAEFETSHIPAFSSSLCSTSSNLGQISIRSLAISTTSASKTLIYAGSQCGAILSFVFDPSQHHTRTDTDQDPGQRLSSTKTSSSRCVRVGNSPVESVIVVAEIDRVLFLSDGFLHLVDRYLSSPVQKLVFLKGVSSVAQKLSFTDTMVSQTDSVSEDGSKKAWERVGRISSRYNGFSVFTNYPQFAAIAGRKLVLCEMRSAGRVNDAPGAIGRVHDYGGFTVTVFREFQNFDAVTTMAWIDHSVIIGTASGYSLFSCITGQFSSIFSLPESSGPPLLKVMHRRKEVLLLVDNVGIASNSLGQPVGGSMIFRHVPEAVGQISMYVVVFGDGKLDVYHRRTGVLVQSIFCGERTGCSVIAEDDGGNEEFLACAVSDKVILFHQLSVEEQIKDLLRKKNIKEAISLVEELQAEGGVTKEMLSFVHAQVGFLLLFGLRFEGAVDHFLQSETMQPSEIFPFIMRDPNRWSSLVPRNRYWGLHPPPIPLEDVVDNGLMAIHRGIFLRKAGVDTGADEGFLSNPPSRAELLESAILNIIRYLKVSRDKDLMPPVKEGIDTLLLYLFRALDLTEDMEKLASSPNNCAVEELESLLQDSGHLRTLAFLYASKGMYTKSLDVWRALALNLPNGSRKDALLRWDVQYPSANSTQKDAATQASHILEESSDKSIVLKHLEWIIEVDEELAVSVLTSEKRAEQLPPEVLATISSKKVEVMQRYLQWLIEDQGLEDSQFHTLYALSLAKPVVETIGTDVAKHDPSAAMLRADNVSDTITSMDIGFLVREKLQFFLDSSDLYDAEVVLDLIEGSELWLEKAILHRKLGHEALVLQILALKLEDGEAAERYCAEIGRPDAYMQLLDMYLDPQDGKEPMFNAAVRLLHNHGESLDPLQVLEKLSPNMPLQLASETLLRMLRARVHHYHQGQIVYNLSRAINLDTRLARFEERTRHVQINDESLCDSCHTRLGTKLFAMYPDDSVVCYKCFRRQPEHICPVNGRDFQRDFVFKPGWLVKKL